MNKQQLAGKIWESANKMRSRIEANEYKDYILGFIFYKFLSEAEVRYMVRLTGFDEDGAAQELKEDDAGLVNHVQDNIGYFISYKNLFSTWIGAGSDFNISDVRDALSAFERLIGANYRKVFDGIFDTLQTGLSKLGESAAAQTKAVRDLIYLIDDIPMDGKQDYDVLGFIYEYLISKFAANAGKKAGEFYTPHEVSVLVSQIVADQLKDRAEIAIFDPTSGSGSLLLNIGEAAARHMDDANKIKYYAQELKQNTYNLTRMNLVMRGIKPDNIVTRNADTLEDDWPFFDDNDPENTYDPLYLDAVVSNPPYSQNWDPTGKESDPRYARFGLAPKSKADYAFLLHDLYHLKPDGVMTIVLPHGVLFRGGEEGTIRRNLIESNHIDTIIGLPPNIFFGTGIPTIIMVLKQKRENTDTLVIDASKEFGKSGKNNILRARDIRRIVDVVNDRADVDKFSRLVSREEIRENDYNLNIPRYVDSSEDSETWDIYASMFGGVPSAEIEQLNKYWDAFPGLKEELFDTQPSGYATGREDPQSIIDSSTAVAVFNANYHRAFDGFGKYLHEHLVANWRAVKVTKEEDVLTENVFARLKGIPLVDRYSAFQMLHEQWMTISLDIETIQREGYQTLRCVDPHMVMKKKNGKDQEVQEGWEGHIIPFDIAQKTLMPERLNELVALEERQETVSYELSELLESLSEEDKLELSDVLNDEGEKFLASPLNRAVQQLGKSAQENQWEEGTPEYIMLRGKRLRDEETKLKKQIKEQKAKIENLTKTRIESLHDDEIDQLLTAKWIEPLLEDFATIPENLLNSLKNAVLALDKKYEETFADLEKQIHDTERELAAMLDDLTGSSTDLEALAEFKNLLAGE